MFSIPTIELRLNLSFEGIHTYMSQIWLILGLKIPNESFKTTTYHGKPQPF